VPPFRLRGLLAVVQRVLNIDGFAVLRAARGEGDLDGLAVGVTGPHGMPEDVRAIADARLDTPRDVAQALSALAGTLERAG